MNEIIKKLIKIDSIERAEGKFGVNYTIKAGGDKFKFYATKKDGNPTKAYTQYLEKRFMIGDTVGVAYTEENKEFTNEKGKLINYKDRRIMFFADQTANSATLAVETPQKPILSPTVDDSEPMIEPDSLPF